MLDVADGYSQVFKKVIHEVLDIIVIHFIEVGSNLEYDEIYGDVFPPHKQDEENREKHGLAFLNKLHREIKDNFIHEFSPLKQYVLYHILLDVHEGSEGTFILSDTIEEFLKKNDTSNLDEEALSVLNCIETPVDLIDICFEDLDFLDVGELFETYKVDPKIVTNFLNVDLEYYKDLMPDDILAEYNQMQEYIKHTKQEQDTAVETVIEINNIDDFYEKVELLIATFKHYIEHKKVHTLLNNHMGQAKEKQVQAAFGMVANLDLKKYGIVISPEVDTGRGAVDFKLSKGTDFQALIEIKLDNHGRYKDGLDYQLPIYLLTEQVDYGYFVLFCYSQKIYDKANILYAEAEELSRKYNKKIKFERIDTSGTLNSASKIHREKDIGFN